MLYYRAMQRGQGLWLCLGVLRGSFTQEVIFEVSLRNKSIPGKKNPLKSARFGGSGNVFRMAIYCGSLYLDSGRQRIISK